MVDKTTIVKLAIHMGEEPIMVGRGSLSKSYLIDLVPRTSEVSVKTL